MVHSPPSTVPARKRSGGADSPRTTYRREDFPGCESFHLPASAVDRYEGRLEFWDARTETAWKVCEPTSTYHERPSRMLVRLAERVASLRGSPIACFGSSDLVRLDASGRKRWLMQADEVLYLHPSWSPVPGPAILVDTDPLPDVVLEVDHTTDVRRRKLSIYMECGFPEIWVLVPWASSRRAPGLAIHVHGSAGYREASRSAAFPGWTVEEIHRALTEDPLSEEAWRALERVARAMGAREGTGPEDDPLMRSAGRRARAEGHQQGHAQGHREGHAEGRREGYADGRKDTVAAMVHAALKGRGIEVTSDFTQERGLLGGVSDEALMAAALACTDEADFRRRVRAAAR